MSYLARANINHGDFKLTKGKVVSEEIYKGLPERLQKKFDFTHSGETANPEGFNKTIGTSDAKGKEETKPEVKEGKKEEASDAKGKTPPVPERKK